MLLSWIWPLALFVCAGARQFSYLSYQDILARVKAVEQRDASNLFDVSYGPDGYPDVYLTDCLVDGKARVPCKYPVVRVANFNKTGEELVQLPQVLLVGGLFGTDRVGPTSLIELLEDIEANLDFYRPVLARMSLVVIPVANPAGYSFRQPGENGVNPIHDFPLFHGAGSNSSCMSTASARFLASLFRRSLISSAFVYALSSTDLTKISRPSSPGHPFFAQATGDAPHATDNDWMVRIIEHVVSSAQAGSALGNFEQKAPENLFVRAAHQNTFGKSGFFADWAYGASQYSNKLKGCSPAIALPTGFLSFKDPVVRALAVEMRVPQDSPARPGHTEAVADPGSGQGSLEGHVARAIRTMRSFLRLHVPAITEARPEFKADRFYLGTRC